MRRVIGTMVVGALAMLPAAGAQATARAYGAEGGARPGARPAAEGEAGPASAAGAAVARATASPSTPRGGELPASGAEILWDTYGVPHIFAADMGSLFRAYG